MENGHRYYGQCYCCSIVKKLSQIDYLNVESYSLTIASKRKSRKKICYLDFANFSSSSDSEVDVKRTTEYLDKILTSKSLPVPLLSAKLRDNLEVKKADEKASGLSGPLQISNYVESCMRSSREDFTSLSTLSHDRKIASNDFSLGCCPDEKERNEHTCRLCEINNGSTCLFVNFDDFSQHMSQLHNMSVIRISTKAVDDNGKGEILKYAKKDLELTESDNASSKEQNCTTESKKYFSPILKITERPKVHENIAHDNSLKSWNTDESTEETNVSYNQSCDHVVNCTSTQIFEREISAYEVQQLNASRKSSGQKNCGHSDGKNISAESNTMDHVANVENEVAQVVETIIDRIAATAHNGSCRSVLKIPIDNPVVGVESKSKNLNDCKYSLNTSQGATIHDFSIRDAATFDYKNGIGTNIISSTMKEIITTNNEIPVKSRERRNGLCMLNDTSISIAIKEIQKSKMREEKEIIGRSNILVSRSNSKLIEEQPHNCETLTLEKVGSEKRRRGRPPKSMPPLLLNAKSTCKKDSLFNEETTSKNTYATKIKIGSIGRCVKTSHQDIVERTSKKIKTATITKAPSSEDPEGTLLHKSISNTKDSKHNKQDTRTHYSRNKRKLLEDNDNGESKKHRHEDHANFSPPRISDRLKNFQQMAKDRSQHLAKVAFLGNLDLIETCAMSTFLHDRKLNKNKHNKIKVAKVSRDFSEATPLAKDTMATTPEKLPLTPPKRGRGRPPKNKNSKTQSPKKIAYKSDRTATFAAVYKPQNEITRSTGRTRKSSQKYSDYICYC